MSDAEKSKVLDENINIKCIDQSGREVFFKLKTTTPFSKMFDAYATKTKLNVAGLRFLFDGTRVNSSDTPDKLQMEDGDVIDIYMEQVGGADDDEVHDNIRVPPASPHDQRGNVLGFAGRFALTRFSRGVCVKSVCACACA